MTVAETRRLRRAEVAFLSFGFRPFFLAAGVWSALALFIWTSLFAHGGALPSWFDPLSWHIHEMLFGFALATIAGFLLTAIPNWTGRAPIAGATLGWLSVLWLLGRFICPFSAALPPWLAVAGDLVFPVALAGTSGLRIERPSSAVPSTSQA